MSKHLHSALLDLIWAHNLDAMQAACRKHEDTAHESWSTSGRSKTHHT